MNFVWRSLRRLGVPEADCDDGCQRVWLVLARKLTSIEPGKVRSYLFSVVVRVASEMRRSTSRRPDVELDERLPDAALPDPERRLEQLRARAVLDDILASMSEELRTVFILFELEGSSSHEIAEILEIRRGTVKSRLRLARDAFQRGLDRYRARAQSPRPLPPVTSFSRSAAPRIAFGGLFMDPTRLVNATHEPLARGLIQSAATDVAPQLIHEHALRAALDLLATRGAAGLGTSSGTAAASFANATRSTGVTAKAGSVLHAASLLKLAVVLPLAAGAAVVTLQVAPRPPHLAAAQMAAALPPMPPPAFDGPPTPAPDDNETPGVPLPALAQPVGSHPVLATGSAQSTAAATLSTARAREPSSLLSDELRLITEARSALVDGNATAALALLSQHRARFPQGKLQIEADVLRQRARTLSRAH
jgi:RNA polymerase sigma-70 factor (ECF subfamily)